MTTQAAQYLPKQIFLFYHCNSTFAGYNKKTTIHLKGRDFHDRTANCRSNGM